MISRFSFRIVSREPGRGWLSCRRDRHLTSSSEGRERHPTIVHFSHQLNREWWNWNRRRNSALVSVCIAAENLLVESCGIRSGDLLISRSYALPTELPVLLPDLNFTFSPLNYLIIDKCTQNEGYVALCCFLLRVKSIHLNVLFLVPMLTASGTYAVLLACVCMYVCVDM